MQRCHGKNSPLKRCWYPLSLTVWREVRLHLCYRLTLQQQGLLLNRAASVSGECNRIWERPERLLSPQLCVANQLKLTLPQQQVPSSCTEDTKSYCQAFIIQSSRPFHCICKAAVFFPICIIVIKKYLQ